MPRITSASIAYQPWIGTPDRPKFLKLVYRVEYETPMKRQNIVEVPATDVWEARQAASQALGFELTLP
jgi:hypothetical protein